MSDDLREIVRELREHYLEHREDGCAECDLFVAWTRQDVAAIDSVIERATDDELIERFRSMRHQWGEGAWTAGDLDSEGTDG